MNLNLRSNKTNTKKKSSLQLQKFNYFLSHAGRVVLCCVSPLLHLAVKWMKSWLIASGAYLACRLRQNQNKQLGLLSYRLCLAVVAEFLLISSAQLSEMSEKRGKFMIRLLEFEAFSQACTGKSLSEDLLFADHGENILCTEIVLNVKNNFCTQHVLSLEFSCIELVIQ